MLGKEESIYEVKNKDYVWLELDKIRVNNPR